MANDLDWTRLASDVERLMEQKEVEAAAEAALPDGLYEAAKRGQPIDVDGRPVAPAVVAAAITAYEERAAQVAEINAHNDSWRADIAAGRATPQLGWQRWQDTGPVAAPDFEEIIRTARALFYQRANEARAAATGIQIVPLKPKEIRADTRDLQKGHEFRAGTPIYGYFAGGGLFIGRLVAQHRDRVQVEFLTTADSLDGVPYWYPDERPGTIPTLGLPRRGTILTLSLPSLIQQE